MEYRGPGFLIVIWFGSSLSLYLVGGKFNG